MEDQAARLRQLANEKHTEFITQRIKLSPKPRARKKQKAVKRARVIAVTSGKGGVGKTNTIVNLALNLARFGRKVAVVDLDLGLANVDILLGLTPQYNIEDVLSGRKTLEEIVVPGPKGVHLIAGGSGVPNLADLSDFERRNLIRAFQSVHDEFDYLLLDTGAGISKNVIEFTLVADDVIVIATPEPTSITDAYAAIKIIGTRNKDLNLHLVMNMVKNEGEAKRAFEKINSVIQQFLKLKVNYLGFIFYDTCVRHAIMKRKPFTTVYPLSLASRSLNSIAKHLIKTETEPKRRPLKMLREFYERVLKKKKTHAGVKS